MNLRKILSRIEKIKITKSGEEIVELKYFIGGRNVIKEEYESQYKKPSVFTVEENTQLPDTSSLFLSPFSCYCDLLRITKKYFVF